jgi:hypothetical protein
MSDSEKVERVGRTVLALRDAKSAVAVSRTALLEYSEKLRGVDHLIKKFLEDPSYTDNVDGPLKEFLKRRIKTLPDLGLESMIDEFEYASRRVAELQEQVNSFRKPNQCVCHLRFPTFGGTG